MAEVDADDTRVRSATCHASPVCLDCRRQRREAGKSPGPLPRRGPRRLQGVAPPVLGALITAFGLGSPTYLTAQASSDEGAPFLRMPVGAEAVGRGRAVTALPGQESAFWNPAGLAALEGSRVVLLRGDVTAGTSTAASALFARSGAGVLGVSYLLVDGGVQENRDLDDNLTGSFGSRDHLAIFSAAAQLVRGVDAGLNFKVVQSSVTCRGDCGGIGGASTTYAVDAGVQIVPSPDLPLRIGAMVAHLGPALQLRNASQADPLPTRLRVAAAWDAMDGLDREDLEGWITLEVQDRPGYSGGTSLFAGAEMIGGMDDALFLRAGYATDFDQPGGVAAGLGIRFEDFRVAVAKSLATYAIEGGEPLTISLSVGF